MVLTNASLVTVKNLEAFLKGTAISKSVRTIQRYVLNRTRLHREKIATNSALNRAAFGFILTTVMDLADILGREQIVPELKATNRWEAIDELIGNLVATGKIQAADRDAVTAAVKKRETSMSTGIGFGIGIPHASTDLIFEVVGSLGRSRGGVNFDALDNQPVKLVMLFLVPQGQFQKHLHTLANIAKLLHKADFREALEKSPDANAMLAVIREHGKK